MFDFGADARAEGGEDGQNHKGLVTFDRKYKKDAFYAYKAWLSEDPFVHICGKRYVDRVEDTTKVTVYSNLPEVELFVNGESLGKQTSKEQFFYFMVPNKGESVLVAKAGACQDESHIRKVNKFIEEYRLKEKGAGGGKEESPFKAENMGPMMQMMGSFTVVRLLKLLGAAGVNLTKEQMLDINAKLNQIKKPE